MHKTCANPWCQQPFEVTDADLSFYEKVSPVFNGKKELIPPPTRCPDCRMQRRMPWRNEMHVFIGKSTLSGKRMMTQFSPGSPYTVYTPEERESDARDPQHYGIDYDIHTSFFPVFDSQLKRIPLSSRAVIGNENCDFANSTSWSKNCYMVGASTRNEDCYYCYNLGESKNCMDCHFIFHCERCYECIHCRDCHRLRYSNLCHDCHESFFLRNCEHCTNCFGCANLTHKKYCIFNQQYSEDEYKKFLDSIDLSRRDAVEKFNQKVEDHWSRYPQKCIFGTMNDRVTGDNIFQSKNAQSCFDASQLQDCTRCWTFHQATDCMDCFGWGRTAELCYDCTEVGDGVSRVICSAKIYNSHDVLYSFSCQGCHHLFGCVSMKNASYCILNTQYTPEEYERIVPTLIETMRKHQEWGEFFPLSIAPFAYNASSAIDYFPIDRSKATLLGASWYEDGVQEFGKYPRVPDSMDSIVEPSTYVCAVSGKPFRIVEQEINFYRSEKIPPPQECFFERTKRRFARNNAHRLYERSCDQCKKTMQTAHAPEKGEIVYCEECYLKEVY